MPPFNHNKSHNIYMCVYIYIYIYIYEIYAMHLRSSLVNNIFWNGIIKNPQEIQLHFCFWTQSLFINILMKKTMSLETSNQYLFRLPNMFWSFLLLVIRHLASFNNLIRREVFELFKKLLLIIYGSHFMISSATYPEGFCCWST